VLHVDGQHAQAHQWARVRRAASSSPGTGRRSRRTQGRPSMAWSMPDGVPGWCTATGRGQLPEPVREPFSAFCTSVIWKAMAPARLLVEGPWPVTTGTRRQAARSVRAWNSVGWCR
jgi:hypothetical protein